MDRNLSYLSMAALRQVALRKESVDRNSDSSLVKADASKSLSARRAWIEICFYRRRYPRNTVALRKESVDRNANKLKTPCVRLVALRKESVDRNLSACSRAVCSALSLSARRAWIEI